MFRYLLFSCLALSAYAQTLSLTSGWNMLGATKEVSSSSLVSEAGERVWKFDGTNWEYYEHGKVGTIKPGQAFWVYLKSNKEYVADGIIGNSMYWNSSWSLVAPTFLPWANLSTTFPTANYIWKFNNTTKSWMLHTEQNVSVSFDELVDVKVGEGVWINSTTHNAMIGESGINISNGKFNTINKDTKIVTSKEELLAMVRNQFNVAVAFDKATSNTTQFQLGIRLTKMSTGSQYYYVIQVKDGYPLNKPYVILQNSANNSIGFTEKAEDYLVLELLNNSSVVRLNFHSMIERLIDKGYFTTSQMIERFNTKTDYKYEIFSTGLDLENSSKLQESVLVGNKTNFAAGSSKIEGTVSIK